MKNSKHNIIYYAIVIVLILLSTIYALAFHKQDILNIFVVYYKPAPLIKTEILIPIQAGRSISNSPSRAGTFTPEEISWLKDNMIGDDTGDNISNLNRYFAEITALYWIYKNTSSPYVGMFQYRRYLSLNENADYPTVEYPSMRFKHLGINHLKGFSKEFLKDLKLEKQTILSLLNTYDIIVSEPIKLNTYEQYAKEHNIKDLDLALNIIKQKYPHMYDFAISELHSTNGFYPTNMFITTRQTLNEYAHWLFSILLPLHNQLKEDLKTRPTEQKLAFAYLSERLFTIYFRYQAKYHNLRIKEYPFALASDFFLPPPNSLALQLKTPLFTDTFIQHPKHNDKICGYNNPKFYCGKYEFLPKNRLKVIWDNNQITYFTHKKDNLFELENQH